MTTSAGDLIRRLHQHRGWVDRNLMAAASLLSQEQLRRRFEIGQGSVWMSLLHLYAAEFVWLEALLGNENPLVQGDLPGRIPGNQLGEGGIASLAELEEKWIELERRWQEYLATLSAESLEDPVYKLASSTGKRLAAKRADVLLHVCTHAQYTTAQVVNMLRHLGLEQFPETMLITLARSLQSQD